VGKDLGGWTQCEYCVHMNVNAKMIPSETIPGMGEWIKESGGGGEFKCDIFDTLQELL
jgi:hypothetical protein